MEDYKKSDYKNISIIGLGKVGLPLAVSYASKRFKVIGVDIDKNKIDLLNKGHFIINEPLLEDLFKKYKNNITFTTDFQYAIKRSSVVFIIVPTPSLKDGSFSLKYIIDVCKKIGHELQNDNSWKLVNIISTVIPDSMDRVIKPLLEKTSNKKVGKDFGLCYSPEFVALGNVICNLFNPDFILIGESDKKSGKVLADIKKRVCDNNPPVHRTNFINAELAKIGSNTFITTKISFANMLARICENTHGANVDVISSILKDDSSIGGKRLIGSIGYGGPCYPRDNKALAFFSRKIGVSADLAESTHLYNEQQTQYLANLVKKYSKKNETIGILGLSYKPNTDVIEESQGIKLVLKLISKKFSVIVYDPMAMSNTKVLLGTKVIYAKSLSDIVNRSDIIIITTPWPEFKNFNLKWTQQSKPKTIIDCWRVLNLKNRKGLNYIPLGVGTLI